MMFVSIGLGVLIALILIGIVSIFTGGRVTSTTVAPPPLVGKTLAPWSQTGLSGTTVAAPWDSGHPTVVVVFASWCGPCQSEFPRLSKYLATHSLGHVALLGVDVQDSPSKAIAFLRQHHVAMTAISDPTASVYGRFLLPGIPDTIFVTGSGRVQNMTVGAISPAAFAAGVAALNA